MKVVVVSLEYLVNVRYNAIGDHLLVLLPVFTVSTMSTFISEESTQGKQVNVLLFTVLVVSPLSVDEEDGEVDNVEVCDRCVELGRQRPCEGHEDITSGEQVSGVCERYEERAHR